MEISDTDLFVGKHEQIYLPGGDHFPLSKVFGHVRLPLSVRPIQFELARFIERATTAQAVAFAPTQLLSPEVPRVTEFYTLERNIAIHSITRFRRQKTPAAQRFLLRENLRQILTGRWHSGNDVVTAVGFGRFFAVYNPDIEPQFRDAAERLRTCVEELLVNESGDDEVSVDINNRDSVATLLVRLEKFGANHQGEVRVRLRAGFR